MNPLLAFFVELYTRFIAPSPRYFRIWQWISGAVVAVTGLPDFLTMFSVTLPHPFDMFANKTVALCGAIAFFMSKMPTKDNSASTLPFTQNKTNS